MLDDIQNFYWAKPLYSNFYLNYVSSTRQEIRISQSNNLQLLDRKHEVRISSFLLNLQSYIDKSVYPMP